MNQNSKHYLSENSIDKEYQTLKKMSSDELRKLYVKESGRTGVWAQVRSVDRYKLIIKILVQRHGWKKFDQWKNKLGSKNEEILNPKQKLTRLVEKIVNNTLNEARSSM